MSVAGSKVLRVQGNHAAVYQNREVRIVRDNAVIAKAEGQRLAGTDQRPQRRGVRAVLDELLGVILDLVSQGHRIRPLAN